MLPANSSLELASDGGILIGNTLYWDLGTVSAGQIGQVKVRTRISAGVANGNLLETKSTIAGSSQVTFTSTEQIAKSASHIQSSNPLGLTFRLATQPSTASGPLTVEMEVTNLSASPLTGVALQMRYPVGLNTLGESFITGPLDEANSCGVSSATLCTANEFLNWNLTTLSAGAKVQVSLPPTVASNLSDGNLVNFLAELSDDNGALKRISLTLPIGTGTDSDNDDFGGIFDNCPTTVNTNQNNFDLDPAGDACDDDDDNDALSDTVEAQLGTNPFDVDSDDDTMPDGYEVENNQNPLLASDASSDPDSDGLTNLQEFTLGTDPNISNNIVILEESSLTFEKKIYFANPASNFNQQSFLRFVNPNNFATNVEIRGTDDDGESAPFGVLRFQLAANASLQLNAQDLEAGNTSKGTSGQLGNGSGKWQLSVGSSAEIETMSLIRTPDGFLTSLNDVVPESDMTNLIYFANPASNTSQQTFLRIVNPSSETAFVTISGIDDNGDISTGGINFTLGAFQSKQMNAQDLENGNLNKGLIGNLGNGSGKWQLQIFSTTDLKVMSLIRTPDGFLTNLSSMVRENGSGNHVIYFANPASVTEKQTFLRIINTSSDTGTVTISAIDDAGQATSGGEVLFELGPNASKQMNAQDLETGNVSKGIMGMLGTGNGRSRLTVSAEIEIQVMSLVRTPDGFLTNLSRTAPTSGLNTTVYFFNPASNTNQVSSLRIVNDSGLQAAVTISGIDDNGNAAPGGDITFNVAANSALEITAQDLENGNALLGLVGSLGNGAGKWRLEISSSADLKVQGLMNTPSGFITNLSQTVD